MSATFWNILQGAFVLGLLPIILKFGKTDNLKVWTALLATYLFHQYTIWQYDFARAYAIDAFLLVPFAVYCFYLGASRSSYFFWLAACLMVWAALCLGAFALSGVASTFVLKEVVNVPIWIFGVLLCFSPPTGNNIDAKLFLKRSVSSPLMDRNVADISVDDGPADTNRTD